MELIGTIISSFNDSMYKTQILEQTKEMQNQLKSGLSVSQCAHWTKDLWFQTLLYLYESCPPKCFSPSSVCPFTASELMCLATSL